MTNDDLKQFRGVIKEELKPLEDRLGGMEESLERVEDKVDALSGDVEELHMDVYQNLLYVNPPDHLKGGLAWHLMYFGLQPPMAARITFFTNNNGIPSNKQLPNNLNVS